MTRLRRIAVLGAAILIAATASGCVIRPYDDGYRQRDRDDHRHADRRPDRHDRDGDDWDHRGR